MGKERLEAFSDGVIAIIITIMVLELKVPHGAELDVLRPLIPVFVWEGQRTHPVGQPAPFVLAVAHPVRDRLDG